MSTEETRVRFAALAERIEASPKRGRWLVLTHDNPDPDALAATAALALILRLALLGTALKPLRDAVRVSCEIGFERGRE